MPKKPPPAWLPPRKRIRVSDVPQSGLSLPPAQYRPHSHPRPLSADHFTAEQRYTVLTLAKYGVPFKDIAKGITNPDTGLPVSIDTLRKYFAEELAAGFAEGNAKIAESLYIQAVGMPDEKDKDGNIITPGQRRSAAAAIFLSKVRLGYSEDAVPANQPDESMEPAPDSQRQIESLGEQDLLDLKDILTRKR